MRVHLGVAPRGSALGGHRQRHARCVADGGTGLDPRASALARLAQELCETGGVADQTFRAALELVGTQGFIELVLTVGYYTMLAMR